MDYFPLVICSLLLARVSCLMVPVQQARVSVRPGVCTPMARLQAVTLLGEAIPPDRIIYSLDESSTKWASIDEGILTLTNQTCLANRTNVLMKTIVTMEFLNRTSSVHVEVSVVKGNDDDCQSPHIGLCFTGNYTLRWYTGWTGPVKLVDLAPFFRPSCYNFSYSVAPKKKNASAHSNWEIRNGGELWRLGRLSGRQTTLRVSCRVGGPAGIATFDSMVRVLLVEHHLPPYPSAFTRVFALPANSTGRKLVGGLVWLPVEYEEPTAWYDNQRGMEGVVAARIISHQYLTPNYRLNIHIIELEMVGVLRESNLTLKAVLKSQSPHQQPIKVEVTMVLQRDLDLPKEVDFPPVVEVPSFSTPYSRMGEPTVQLGNLEFRLLMPTWMQAPLGLTGQQGILYLQPWATQMLPCNQSCPSFLVVEWLRGNRVVGGRVVGVVWSEGEASSCPRISHHHWPACAEYARSNTCLQTCSIATRKGKCSWRGPASPPEGGTTTTAGPSAVPYSLNYSTCRAEPAYCPDTICDPLEQLDQAICPQDCTRAEVHLGRLRKGSSGIASGKDVCTCTRQMCHCGSYHDPEDTSAPPLLPTRPPHVQHATPLHRTAGFDCDNTCKIGLSVSSIVLCVSLTALIYIQTKRVCRRKAVTQDHYSTDPLVPLTTLDPAPFRNHHSQSVQEVDPKWEVPRSRLEVLNSLGEGEFGTVLKANVKDLPSRQGVSTVAVKTLKENAGQTELADLMSEYQLLKDVNHPNVIRLLGACTTPGGPIYLIIEYCALGSLRQYLRKCQKVEHIEEKDITPRQILSFSWQISKGMTYLAEMKLVHRDLATRNILLTETKQCKISDFGMTRDVYVDDTYLRISRGKVPVKWMAIESLRDHIYTSKSDVWSFGIVLWELVTLGSNPYPGIPIINLYNQLKAGYRMQQPPNCSHQLYDIMCKCWFEEPGRRPSFNLLTEMFDNMLEQDIEYLNCNIHAFNNPEYFSKDDSDNDRPPSEEKSSNFNITFSMSLENLKPSEEPDKTINLYENNLSQINDGYDIPKPVKQPSFKTKNNKDPLIEEKVDNR